MVAIFAAILAIHSFVVPDPDWEKGREKCRKILERIESDSNANVPDTGDKRGRN
jgi:hypothetical protein